MYCTLFTSNILIVVIMILMNLLNNIMAISLYKKRLSIQCQRNLNLLHTHEYGYTDIKL